MISVRGEQSRRSLVIVTMVFVVSSLCAAQETIGPISSDAETFAVELASSPAAKRTELLAAHPERITIALRKELIQHGNLRFASAQYAQALEIVGDRESQLEGARCGPAARLNTGAGWRRVDGTELGVVRGGQSGSGVSLKVQERQSPVSVDGLQVSRLIIKRG